METIAALRKELAQQPRPVQEPVLQDIEQYRMQMAGISTAAIGYWKEGDGIHPDYDTLALRDVAKLYAKYDEIYKAQPEQEPVASPYNPNPVDFQYHYPDGSWRCSNGKVRNGMHPDRARSLYALKDNT